MAAADTSDGWEAYVHESVASVSGKGRYTCVDGDSKGRLMLGAASGMLHIFQPAGSALPEIVPLPGATARISQVRVSPTDAHVAVAVASELFILTTKYAHSFSHTQQHPRPTPVLRGSSTAPQHTRAHTRPGTGSSRSS